MRQPIVFLLALVCMSPVLSAQARLGMDGDAVPGGTLNFHFTAPGDGGALRIGALSFSASPGILIPAPDGRTIPLNPDLLFHASLGNSALLPGFLAPLDSRGLGKGTLRIPPFPAFIGIAMVAAYCTYDPVMGKPPWFAKSISNPVEILIRPSPPKIAHLAVSHWRPNKNLSLFTLDSTSGNLIQAKTPQHASGGTSAYGMEALGKRLFAANFSTDNISSMELTSTGSLASVPGSPFKAGGKQTILCRYHKGLLFATHENTGNITVFRVAGATGALTPVSGSPFSTGGKDPGDMVVVHGRLYVALALSDAVVGFDVNLQTGALKRVVSSAPGRVFSPWALATGYGFLFAGNVTKDSITVFEVNHKSGALTQIPGSPFANPGKTIETLAFCKGLLFTTNRSSDSVSVFRVDPHTGALSAAKGSPILVGKAPIGLAVHGDKALVGNNLSATISVFTVNFSTGALTPVSGSPFKDPIATPCHLGLLY